MLAGDCSRRICLLTLSFSTSFAMFSHLCTSSSQSCRADSKDCAPSGNRSGRMIFPSIACKRDAVALS